MVSIHGQLLFPVIQPNTEKLQPFKITLKHCSEAVGTLPLHAAQPALDHLAQENGHTLLDNSTLEFLFCRNSRI